VSQGCGVIDLRQKGAKATTRQAKFKALSLPPRSIANKTRDTFVLKSEKKCLRAIIQLQRNSYMARSRFNKDREMNWSINPYNISLRPEKYYAAAKNTTSRECEKARISCAVANRSDCGNGEKFPSFISFYYFSNVSSLISLMKQFADSYIGWRTNLYFSSGRNSERVQVSHMCGSKNPLGPLRRRV
jgi:hypothetical protein